MGTKRKSSFIVNRTLLALFVCLAIASAQITMNRHWIRGRYARDSAGISEFQRLPKGVYQKVVSNANPDPKPQYFPILMNLNVLEKITDMDPAPSFGSIFSSMTYYPARSVTSPDNSKK